MKLCPKIECRAAGAAAFTFCIGAAAGLLLPIYFVAALECAMLLILSYFCLFVW